MTYDESIARSLRRIADTLDDYMTMSLAAGKATQSLQREMADSDPVVGKFVTDLLATLDTIARDRTFRDYRD